jgi:hypothetical protein
MIVLVWILFGIGAAIVASQKGRNGVGWFFLGILLGPFGLIFALLLKSVVLGRIITYPPGYSRPSMSSNKRSVIDEKTKQCPQCAEIIKLAALKCRYCGEVFSKEKVESAIEESWRIKDEDYNDPRFCPFCRQKTVIPAMPSAGHKRPWCPVCKKDVL